MQTAGEVHCCGHLLATIARDPTTGQWKLLPPDRVSRPITMGDQKTVVCGYCGKRWVMHVHGNGKPEVRPESPPTQY